MKSFLKTHLKTALFLTIISAGLFTINAQESQNSFWDNVRFGGGLGLGLGNGFFSGSIAPSAIYEFNSQFAAGIGLNATYAKQKNLYQSTILGASIITLFNPIEVLQLSGEFEELKVKRNFVSNIDDNYWYPALYLGIGYRTGNVTFGIRYDVLYDDDKSIFADPWMPFFRFYF